MDAATDLEKRFLPQLDDAAADLRARFPGHKIHVYAASVGGRTPLDGYSVVIDCLIPGSSDDTSDTVGLEIGLAHIRSSPEFCVADVCWGAPEGTIEAELDVRGHPYTGESIEDVHAGLTYLLDALARALARGKPPLEGD